MKDCNTAIKFNNAFTFITNFNKLVSNPKRKIKLTKLQDVFTLPH